MYPGTACNKKEIPVRMTKPFHFNENEDEVKRKKLLAPAVNISETEDEYLIVMAAPGLDRNDFKIEIDDLVISISAKKDTVPFNRVKDRCEYDYTDWTRAFILPEDADTLLSLGEYQNGELIIHIPRSDSSDNQSKTTICVY